LRSVSIFSGELQTDSTDFGRNLRERQAALGKRRKLSELPWEKACPGVILTGAGLGGVCFAR
jgi:hypothetical protein